MKLAWGNAKSSATTRAGVGILLWCLLAISGARAQQKKSVPPPPKPKDEGPSLEVTMKFIQDKMNDHGTVGWVYTSSNLSDALYRYYYQISYLAANASTCMLFAKETTTVQIEVAEGTTFNEDGKAVTGDDLRREVIETSTSSFKDVDTLVVESAQDRWNRRSAEAAHAEVTAKFTPAVYNLSLKATKKDAFSFHQVSTRGKHRPQDNDYTGKELTFTFRDEETANRIAKAMLHAVELCGGGNKDPF